MVKWEKLFSFLDMAGLHSITDIHHKQRLIGKVNTDSATNGHPRMFSAFHKSLSVCHIV
jgi:hypothetical protein